MSDAVAAGIFALLGVIVATTGTVLAARMNRTVKQTRDIVLGNGKGDVTSITEQLLEGQADIQRHMHRLTEFHLDHELRLGRMERHQLAFDGPHPAENPL